jgi:hypothetical protein
LFSSAFFSSAHQKYSRKRKYFSAVSTKLTKKLLAITLYSLVHPTL